MTIQQIYGLAIEMGMKADPRGYDGAKKQLRRNKKTYEDLPDKKKKYFDLESLENPYSDSRFLYGDPNKQIKKVLAGIDADAAELLLADRLNHPPKGEGIGIDLVIAHHPAGHALAGLHEVMEMQTDVYAKYGVPVNLAHALVSERMGEVERKFLPLNHNQTIDTARLLQIPLLALHTIWDNMGDQFVKNYLNKREFETVGKVLEYVKEIPEFVESSKGKAGPRIVSGGEGSRAGKIGVFFTGGTQPSKEMYAEWAKAGVGTLVDMHIPEHALKEMKKLHVNVIDVGHIAPDSIGANLFLDVLEKKGIAVIPCSGLIRVRRSV